MLRVVLFALLAIGLGSCKDKATEIDELYSSLLSDGKPLFDVTNGNALQKVLVVKEGKKALVVQIPHNTNEVTFQLNEKTYTLFAYKIVFSSEDQASLELQFEHRNPTTAATNIAVKTVITPNAGLQLKHGLKETPLPKETIDYLLKHIKKRERTTVVSIKWVSDIFEKKKPMFKDIRRGPATLEFVIPPIIIGAAEFNDLYKLKEGLATTYKEAFYTMVQSGASLIGASRNARESDEN